MVGVKGLRAWSVRSALAWMVGWSLIASVEAENPPGAKNVILMIADGAGFNAYRAASFYEHGELGHQPYDGFPVHVGCTTFSLSYADAQGKGVSKLKDAAMALPQGYDPRQMWEGPKYVVQDPTDSAAAATALYTGVKTTDGRMGMNWNAAESRVTIAEVAHSLGKATGVISSVQASHATPGAMWSHEPSRDEYAAIFNKMVYRSGLDVIMGAGHPLYDDDAKPAEKPDYKYVGGESTWADLTDSDGIRGHRFLDAAGDFAALADGKAPGGGDLPAKVVGIARARKTLQFGRSGSDPAPACPRNEGVPDLATMSRAALRVLQQDQEGFVLMIEGGAVDWANHANQLGRMVEEQVDFHRAVAAVVDWVEKESSWDETLVIVTADHECGMIWSPDSFRDTNANGKFDADADEWLGFVPVTGAGKGVLPNAWYGSKGHTNALVPVWAKGPAADLFLELVDGVDARAGAIWGFSGRYVDNTDIFTVMQQAVARPWIAPIEDALPLPEVKPVEAAK